MSSNPGRLARLSIVAGTEIFLIGGISMLFYGKLNGDEAWYLYAGKLVYEGQIPYRNFAFTQMPLLPYIYGIPQFLFGQGMLVGRATSLFFAILSFLLALKVAHRYSGTTGAGLTAIFLGTFFFGMYNLTIVKTYALVTFFFMLTFFLLSSNLSEAKKYSLAVTSMFLAGVTRLSAMPAAFLILIYVLWVASNHRTRLLALGVSSLLSFFTLLVLAMDPGAALWNLWTYHRLWWGDATLAEKIIAMLVVRPLSMVFGEVAYTFYFLLIVLFSLLVLRDTALFARVKTYLLRRHEFLAISAAIFLFLLAHIQNGNWLFEYFVPGIFILILILSIGFVKIHTHLKSQPAAQTLIAGMLGFSLVVFPVQQSARWLDFENGQSVLARTRQISEYVASFTEPDASILVMEALWISIESGRDPLPGYSMAQFSYLPFEDQEEVREYKLVNFEILRNDIQRGEAKAVILTNVDWEIIGNEGAATICEALHQNYVLARTIYQSERHGNVAYIYRPQDGSPPSQSVPADPCTNW